MRFVQRGSSRLTRRTMNEETSDAIHDADDPEGL
jgi:hypothetical protein